VTIFTEGEAIEKLQTLKFKIKRRQWYEVDQINDAENMTAAKRKNMVPIIRKWNSRICKSKRKNFSLKEDEVNHQDIDEKINDP
jgi:hypothetical protein